MVDSYRINRMIQDLNGDPEARERHRADPAATYARYDIDAGEQALLADGSIAAMTRLGVHPNLQMKWMFINAKGPPPGPGPLASFLGRLLARPTAETN
jgi:hypothetical protein